MEYSPRGRPSELADLKAELIRNAAFVAHEGRKAFALSRWLVEREDRRVIYVFDTDVIVAYCAPWRNGPADDEYLGRGYGQILPQKPLDVFPIEMRQQAILDERRKAEVVCWLLASKAIQRSLGANLPILQTKSHFNETLRVYEGVKTRASAETTSSRTTALEREDRRFSQAIRMVRQAVRSKDWQLPGNPGRFLGNTLHQMQLQEVQRTSRFVREWDSFLDLVRLGSGIFELQELQPGDGSLTATQRRSWESATSVLRELPAKKDAQRIALEQAMGRFVAPDRYQLSREKLEDDVTALADIASINERLVESGDDSTRVVLITGDRKIVLALAGATKYELPGSTKGRSISDFAYDCVHHLWSFVDGITIEADSADRASLSGSGLFSGLLAFDDEERSGRSFVNRLATYAALGEPGLSYRLVWEDIGRAYERWEDFSEAAANLNRHFLVDRDKSREISRILIDKFRASDAELDEKRLRLLVWDTIARARDRTNVELSEIGANSILDAHRHGVRNPPDLMFESLTTTNRIFRDLALPKRIFINSQDFAQRFERIVDDCYQPGDDDLAANDDYRQECYLKYLVLGALFASADRWMLAEQHAESAVAIVRRAEITEDPIRTKERSGGPKSNMSGREAYFLLAVARRIRAKKPEEYLAAADALTIAESCWLQDRSKNGAASVPRERFDNERLALALARYYTEQKSDVRNPSNPLADAIYRLVRPLGKLLEEDDASSGMPRLPASTRSNIATNVLQVAMISRFREAHGFLGEELSPINRSMVKIALATLIRHTNLSFELARSRGIDFDIAQNDDKEIICSALMMFYAVAAAACYDEPGIWRPQTIAEVDDFFRFRKAIVTDYDGSRFSILKDLTKRSIRPG